MNLQHLREMGLSELVVRSRQEARKWWGRVSESAGAETRPHTYRTSLAEGRFFDGARSADLPRLLAERMPGARDAIVASAHAACRHQFDLLGYANLGFGDPIDWHLDPVSGRRAPLLHWSRINPLDSAAVGDAKVIWELNRHQWLVRLAQAYRLDRDERYACIAAGNIRRWLDANPPGMGINWASSLEVAFRLISWCWTLCLFRDSPALSPQVRDLIVNGIERHAAHVERYLSYYFSPNTHLTGEALGLFYAGTLLPGLPRARRWRSLGARILVEHCDRQILGDGVYFEQATGYSRYTLEIYLQFVMLSAKAGEPVAPAVIERLHRLLDFLLAIRRPDGTMPQIGDADSGSLLPLLPRAQHDFRGVFSLAAALFGRADCAWAAGGATPEILWTLGPAGLAAFDALAPAPPKAPSSRCFPDGGWVVMQSGWAATRHQLTFDAGSLGCPITGGHGHADLLGVQCAVFGEPYIVDAGTFTYTADAASRTFFRGTAAHSTVMIDDEPQAFSTGPFQWSERPRATLREWRSSRLFDYADAEHEAFRRLGGVVVHRRRIVFVKARGWVVVDDLTGDGTHKIDVRFQFAPIAVSLDTDLQARARGRSEHALIVRAFSRAPLGAHVFSGALAPIQGWVSGEYGQREPAPVLVYTTTAALPLRIITVLQPVADPDAEAPAVTPEFDLDRSAEPAGLTFATGERVRFDDLGVQVTAPGVFLSPPDVIPPVPAR